MAKGLRNSRRQKEQSGHVYHVQAWKLVPYAAYGYFPSREEAEELKRRFEEEGVPEEAFSFTVEEVPNTRSNKPGANRCPSCGKKTGDCGCEWDLPLV